MRCLVALLICASAELPAAAQVPAAPSLPFTQSMLYDGGTVRVAASQGYVELTVSPPGGGRTPLAGVIRGTSVEGAASFIVRARLDPDSVAAFLARVDPFEDMIHSTPGQYVGRLPVTTGRDTAFQLIASPSNFSGPDAYIGVAVHACFAPRESPLDYRTPGFLPALRLAVTAAMRQHKSITAMPPVTCPPRPPRMSVLPALARDAVGREPVADLDADLQRASDGRVVAVHFAKWNGGARALRQLDSTLRQWRFDTTRSDGVGGQSQVRLRLRFRPGAVAELPDSMAALRMGAARAGRDFVVPVPIIDRQSSRMIRHANVSLYVDDAGNDRGLPIVLVHSVGARASQWTPLLTKLRPWRRVVAMDLRGHGTSSAASDYSIEAQAADIAAVLDTLDIRRCILVGQGTGATIVAEVARANPSRVAGAVYVTPVGDYHRLQPAMASVLDTLRNEARRTDSIGSLRRFFYPRDAFYLERVVQDLRATPSAAVEGTISAAKSYDVVGAMAAYHAPVLAVLPQIKGERRPPFDQAAEQFIVTELDGGRWLYVVNADALRNAIEAFAYGVEALWGSP